MRNDQLLGSQTAKNGFLNEADIVTKFNNWTSDEDAQKWLFLTIKGDFPNTEMAAECLLSLPLYPEMTDDMVEYVIKNLNELL